MLDTGVSGCRVSFNDQKERLPRAVDNSHVGRSDFKRKSRAGAHWPNVGVRAV